MLARERAGTQFDPALVALLLRPMPPRSSTISTRSTSWDAVIDSEPALARRVSDEQFDAALEAIADFVDLKSPYTLGHSRAVAELARGGRARSRPAASEVRELRRAGLVHDFGRLGVSNAIWDKRGPLDAGEWERVRLHPYFTERMLRLSTALAPLGAIAGQHHERLDGSGYPRGCRRRDLAPPARILAAADVYQRCASRGPHRPARSPTEAAARAAQRGAGGPPRRRRRRCGARRRRAPRPAPARWPAGLTAREVEVLRLLARGLSNKRDRRAARDLAEDGGQPRRAHLRQDRRLEPRTASLFAMQHGLLQTRVRPTPRPSELREDGANAS